MPSCLIQSLNSSGHKEQMEKHTSSVVDILRLLHESDSLNQSNNKIFNFIVIIIVTVVLKSANKDDLFWFLSNEDTAV